MPNRPNTVKVDSSGVQGEGSFVEFKRLTWGERQEIIKKIAELEGASYRAFTVEFMIDQLISWNWVDHEGNALPMPKNEVDLNNIYPEESEFLFNLAIRSIMGKLTITDNDLKN